MGAEKYKDGFKIRTHTNALNIPFTWRKSKLVFVNSMSDLFHTDVPIEFIKEVFSVMNQTPQHTYQVLTKRSDRLLEISPSLNWTSNIWMGVSVELDKYTFRVEELSRTPAKVKFISVEPLIGPVRTLPLNHINWVIVGGESGHKARPLKKAWVELIKNQCEEKQIPFFFKQWGKSKFNIDPTDPTIHSNHPHHAKGGCQLDGKVYRQLPFTAA